MANVFGTDASDTLNGTSTDDQIFGLGGADRLSGKDGNDILFGGAGKDTLAGGAGADTFVLDPADANSADKMSDFAAEDWIGIFASDYGLSVGHGLIDIGSGTLVLDPAYFTTVSDATTQGTASGHGQFVYNTKSRTLMWDADGAGGAVGIALATFNKGVVLTAADFAVLPPPIVGDISITDVAITEGNSGSRTATFVVSRTGLAAFTVGFATADGTATAGLDYVASAGTLNFALGQMSRTVSVTINADTTFEPNETFFLNLANASGGTIVDPQGVATIINDDAQPTLSVADGTPNPQTEATGAQIGFQVTLSNPASQDVVVTYSTVNGTAVAGQDFTAITNQTATIAAGSTSTTVYVDLIDDSLAENREAFTVQLSSAQLAVSGTPLAIADSSGIGNIADNDSVGPPTVLAIHDMRPIGSTDPSGLAYIPGSGTLFLSDSEVEETPFFRTNNLFALNLDGTLKPNGAISLLGFTDEPTGLAYDPTTGHMWITDDDQNMVFRVDPANPTSVISQFSVGSSSTNDPEDIAVDPSNGHLFIVNGVQRTIVERTNTGAIVTTINLPTVIEDPEALAYDAVHDAFYVSGGFTYKIWRVNRQGQIEGTLEVLNGYSNPAPGGPGSVHVKDMEFAPSSNPNDDPAKLSLYVADYGNSHVDDGRLFEIDLGTFWV